MKDEKPSKLGFHPEAAARFAKLAEEALKSVRSFASIEMPRTTAAEIHPVAHFTTEDVIGEIKVVESSFNGLGEETGRYWTSNGLRVGWEGNTFEAIKGLADRMGNTTPIKGQASSKFMLDETFIWLRETLEGKRSEPLPVHIGERCLTEIKDYEIWVPIYRTYSAADFEIGEVGFRTVSKVLLDEWYARIPQDVANKPEVAHAINRKRARIQGSIAACIRVKAEVQKAREIAQSAA